LEVINIAKDIDWSGRLWRDEQVKRSTAWRQMRESILKTSGEIYAVNDAAFGVFERNRVKLIGVHPAAKGFGLASIIIKHAFHEKKQIIAGTYWDNDRADRLYSRLGMAIIDRQDVWHK
jgi:GNAT superfamily N-acetyltransferase